LTYHNYARGSKDEYDAWKELGNPGWDWDNLHPYFTKLDDVTPGPVGWLPNNTQTPGLANARDGATGGPIKVGFNGNNTATTQYVYDIHEAFVNRGAYVNADPEGGNSTGLTLTARSIDPKTNTRSYSTTGYLQPVLERENLLVLINAEATKIMFDKNTISPNGELKNNTLVATGIQYGQPNTEDLFVASAKREVILSAGSLKSPQLLELSGVGNSTLLKSLDIPVALDLPEVGENLQDHLEFNTDFLLKEDAPYETWGKYTIFDNS
jgi:choline dehydrogenase-like flavoprotein